MYTDEKISEIVSRWNLKFRKSCPELEIAGSPERTTYRIAIEDEDHSLWVLESTPPDLSDHKQRICRTLAFLHEQGLVTVHPYLQRTFRQLLAPGGRIYLSDPRRPAAQPLFAALAAQGYAHERQTVDVSWQFLSHQVDIHCFVKPG